MVRKLPFIAVVIFALSAAAQSSLPAIPTERATDSYSIYSLLMPGQPFSSMSPSQTVRWAIAKETVNITDMNPAIPPDGQLTPPPDNPGGFEEALQDYESRKYERFRLETTHFHLSHAFSLLNEEQVSELREARSSTTATSDLKARYAGYPGVTFFSAVYYNDARTAALVFMNNWCANLCAAGQWVYLEKQGGHWVRRSGISRGGA
ncbi:MAG: hypothetical protein WBD10_10105 [Acidobacteriaceae bacterium]